MKPFDRLSGYLSALERRMRWLALTRGAAATAIAALALTVLAVIAANQFAFSHPSVVGARVFLFLGIAFAIAAALIVPLVRLNRRRAARAAETSHPDFEERLLTFTERSETHPGDPFLHLLAADALTVADRAEPKSVVKTTHLFGFSSAAVAAIAVLLWIATFQGFLGYGTGLLWGSVPKGATKAFYSINVTPGNKTVRKRSDQVIAANLVGFTSPKVQLFAKYASASQWEGADMRVQDTGSAYQFLIAGVPESLEYYVEAGGVRSQTYKLNVVDLPAVKKVAVTFHYPAYLGLKDATEDPGGDLRAVQGTVGEVFVTFDKPLATGELVLDDGSKIALAQGPNNTLTAKVPVEKDGMYHVAAVESGDDVRLSEDYFIEAMKDEAPEVSITRPGRDFRANPIEEVTVAVSAKDDFGLKDVALHYSVNGAPEKTVPMLQAKGAKESNGSTVLSLEDFKVEPGDVVSIYATANDARNTSKTDIFFIQAEPFERNYTQSQQEAGGAGMGGGQGGDEQNQISQRQKEIITATWNQAKGTGARGTDAENAAFLSGVQSKLREQAASLAQRMKSRELDAAGDSFKNFISYMEQAVTAMQPAADKLKAAKWQDALAPEQKALQYLLRAEDTFRDIQVSMGRQGGGGGGGGGMNGATRDLEGLFDLELDTQKNQYENQSSGQSANQQQQQVDDALQKLAELAKRQQELSEQQKKNPQSASQQRYEQEMLRREAEQLRQQLDQLSRQQQQNQLSRDGQQSQQQSQQGQPGQSGQSGQSGQQGQMSQQSQQSQQGGQSADQQMQQRLGQMSQRGQQQNQQNQQNQQGQQQQAGQDQRLRGASAEQLKKALDALSQAEQDMRNAQQQGSMQSDAEAKRAADRLNDAAQMLSNLRQQQSSNQLEQLAQQADQAARQQQQFEGDLRRAAMQGDGLTREQAGQLADRHQAQVNDVKKLEQGMQNAVRDLMGTQRQASNKLRQTLGDMEQAEIPRDMQRDADWIRRGMAEYAAMSEAQITAGLNELRDRMEQLRKDMAAGQQQKAGQDGKGAQQALNNVEQLRQLVEQRAAQVRGQNGQGQQGKNGQQRQGQQLSRNGQQAGQQGQQGQQGGQQGQQSGQQGQQGGQQGQQGQPGQGQQGGQPNGANNAGGNWSPQGGPNYNGGSGGGYVRDQDIQQAYRNALQSLQQLQQEYHGDANATRDLNNTIRDLRQFDPYALNNDQLLGERIQGALGNIEQAEMELRRKVEEAGGGDGSIRSPSSEPTPQGYGSAVAEYWRKLSKMGKQ